MRNISGSRVSQGPLAIVHNLQSICETNLPDEEPFFPASTIIVDLQWVDANLGLKGGGLRTGEERDRVVAGVIAIHRGSGQWTGGFRGDEGGEYHQ